LKLGQHWQQELLGYDDFCGSDIENNVTECGAHMNMLV